MSLSGPPQSVERQSLNQDLNIPHLSGESHSIRIFYRSREQFGWSGPECSGERDENHSCTAEALRPDRHLSPGGEEIGSRPAAESVDGASGVLG